MPTPFPTLPTLLLWTIFISVGSVLGAYPQQPKDSWAGPEFDPSPMTISVSPGETATLPCRVRNLGDKLVSWIRRRDLHIISSGRLMFTGDSRFHVISLETDPASWSLQLRNARTQDEGLYECQVNTDPKMKQAVLLTVSDKPEVMEMSKDDSTVYGTEGTSILGPKERHIRLGSTLTLTCHVKLTPHVPLGYQRPIRLVEWLRDDNVILYNSEQRVSVDTEKNGEELSSTLTVTSIKAQGGGKYTCRPHGAPSASIMVVLVEGERSEAMQGQTSDASRELYTPSTVVTLLLVCVVNVF